MSEFFAELLKFLTKPTWPKALAAFCLIVFGFIALICYERYTSSFQLNRLQRAADLLARLQEIQLHGTNNTPDLQRAYAALTAQTFAAIAEKPISLKFVPSTFTFSVDSFRKFFAGAAIWLAFALFQLPRVRTEEGRATFRGLLIIASTSGFVGMFVPDLWWPWFHILIYPWLFLAALMTAALPVAFVYVIRSGLKSAGDKARQIACISNLKQIGLAARRWANGNGDVLPSSMDSISKELRNGKVIFCPDDNTTHYEIVTPGCGLTDPSVVYARCPIHHSVVLADGSAHLQERRESASN